MFRKATIADCEPWALFWTESADMRTKERSPAILLCITEPDEMVRPGNMAWMALYLDGKYWNAFQIQVGPDTHWYIREEEST